MHKYPWFAGFCALLYFWACLSMCDFLHHRMWNEGGVNPLKTFTVPLWGYFRSIACKEENTLTYAHTHTHSAGVCAWSVGYGPCVGLSLPVIYKGIRPLSSSLFLTQPQGLDSLLTNNIAANGPEPAVDLPADHTRSNTVTTVRLHLHSVPLEEVPLACLSKYT